MSPSPPSFSFPTPSSMLSRLGLWNVVLGNNSIVLIISLHKRGQPPLSEHSPIVDGWCNLMWHENSSSIFLCTAFLETAHCFTRSLLTFFHSNSHRGPFSRRTPRAGLRGVRACVCEQMYCMGAQVHVSRELGRMCEGGGGHKMRCNGKRRRQKT